MNNQMSVFGGALACVCGAVLSFAAQADEAVLTDVDSPVMVNQGATYVEAHEAMSLNAGDRVLVMRGGRAQIAMADGCERSLGSQELWTVPASGSCNRPAAAATNMQLGGTPTGTGSTGGGTASSTTSSSSSMLSFPKVLLPVGVVGAAGYVGYKAFDDDGGNNRNISP